MAKLTKPMVNLINEQIQAELESAYLYLAMSNYYIEKGFPGFGTWFKKQAEEEEEHAEKFIDYLHGNDETQEFVPLEIFELYFEPGEWTEGWDEVLSENKFNTTDIKYVPGLNYLGFRLLLDDKEVYLSFSIGF